MAIDLLNSFLQRGQNVSTNSQSASNINVQNLPQNIQVMRAIKALQAGQTLRGEIISVKGDEVRLAIMKDVLIDAKLAGNMQLTEGVTMPFQVKANNSNGLSLIPLFTNIASDPNVMKALEMAKLPINERSMEMVQSLMEKGMPIDKQSLQETYREVLSLKDTPVKDIISLKQLQLPVNRENANQLSAYENNQHYLKDTFSDMGKVFANQFEELVLAGKTQEVQEILGKLEVLFRPIVENGIKQDENIFIRKEDGGLEGAKTIPDENMVLRQTIETTVSGQVGDIKDTQVPKTAMPEVFGKVIEDIPPKTLQSEEEKQTKELSISIKNNPWEELLNHLGKEKESGKISRMFEKIWNKEIRNHWLMEPETLKDKNQVKSYYENLESQIRQLEKILEDTNLSKSPIAKLIQNTSSNLDFMNQLNQMHAYIQLPLKMSHQNAKGELYVFSNKKNLTKQNGKVTALLHLDMEFLGKMDIYVALENSNVSTNFYLEKEEYLELIESHMELLTARLEKRGYSCSVKATLRNEEEGSVMKMIEKQQGQAVLLSTQAFDVRA
ncbi:MAG: flagellar hook-length control protein FliK [Lachnospiraceae bacterium]|nr:flagellar hook-length control protein FliK [Lachnospiraceae bacterium]